MHETASSNRMEKVGEEDAKKARKQFISVEDSWRFWRSTEEGCVIERGETVTSSFS